MTRFLAALVELIDRFYQRWIAGEKARRRREDVRKQNEVREDVATRDRAAIARRIDELRRKADRKRGRG